MFSIVTEIILVALIVTVFKGLQLNNDIILNSIKDTSQKRLEKRSILSIAALLFILWRLPGYFNDAQLKSISSILFIIIVYETVSVAAMMYYRQNYVDILKRIGDSSPVLIKIPVVIELLFFIYLLIRIIIIEWGFLFS